MTKILSGQLLARCRPGAAKALSSLSGLEDYLSGLLKAVRGAWPTLEVKDVAFLSYVAERLPETGTLQGLNELHAEDLYLACGCALGHAKALRLFDQHFLSAVDPVLGRMDTSGSLIDEVKQELRHKLFVAPAGSQAKIVEYSGRGSLLSWLRAVAVRTALNRLRGTKPSADEAEMLAVPTASADPEVAFIRGQYREDFRAAFQEALKSLSSRERNVLRMHAIDGLGIDEIGRIYKVHRATAARWLARSRQLLLEETKRKLAERLSLNSRESSSLMNQLQSQIDLSLHRLLRSDSNNSGKPPPADSNSGASGDSDGDADKDSESTGEE
jgi:RNA polymerase sigma-70 factor (ECF subfamily)